jgi:hypothetical protein
MKTAFSARTVAGGLAVLSLALAIGCGGDGVDLTAGSASTATTSGSGGGVHAGTYASNLTLSPGRQGDLSVTVGGDGRASGTLVVSSLAGALAGRPDFSWTVGAYSVSGTVDADGSFRMSGTIEGQTFVVSGDIDGSYTIVVNGETWSGSFPTGGTTAGTTAGTTSTTAGTTSGLVAQADHAISYSSPTGDAPSENPYAVAPQTSTLTEATTSGVRVYSGTSAFLSTSAVSPNSLVFAFYDGGFFGSNIKTGTVLFPQSNGGVTVGAGIFKDSRYSTYFATSGSIDVTSITATDLTIECRDLRLEKLAPTAESPAGSFVVNGRFKLTR